MGSVTGGFTSESPLHPAAREILIEAIDRGWADPSKIHQPSRELALLLEESKTLIAGHLKVEAGSLHFLGERNLGYLLGISGLRTPATESTLFYPTTSRSEVIAIAEADRLASAISVDLDGSFICPVGGEDDLLAATATNVETGAYSPDLSNFQGRIFIDATADPLASLPARFSSALWESSSWSGPQGLSIFSLQERQSWRNPLPHLDHEIVPGGFNPALAIASAVAFDAYVKDWNSRASSTLILNECLRSFISDEIGDVDIASPKTGAPHFLSFSFLYVDAQQLVDRMSRLGFALDSGSACTSANLEPSHVLAAMGRLTHGNVRVRLHSGLTKNELLEMLTALKIVVEDLRSNR